MWIQHGYKDQLIDKGVTTSITRQFREAFSTNPNINKWAQIVNLQIMWANGNYNMLQFPSPVIISDAVGTELNYTDQHTQPGLYKNRVTIPANTGTVPGGIPDPGNPFQGDDVSPSSEPTIGVLYYYLFYKAKAVLKHNGVNVAVNDNVEYAHAGAANPIHTFDWFDSFGELGVTASVLKEVFSIVNGQQVVTLVNAIVGQDYEIVSQTADTMQIKFLAVGKYKFEVKADGYHSNDNPYPLANELDGFMSLSMPDSRKVLSNSSIKTFYIRVRQQFEIAPSTFFKMTYPEITPILTVIDPVYELNDDPLTTFILVGVEIKADVDFATGKYEEISLQGNPPIDIAVSDPQWFQYIEQDLIVDLYIKNSALNIHDSFLNIDIGVPIIYGFYPDDHYEVYYDVRLS